MKKSLLFVITAFSALFAAGQEPVADQNHNYMLSRTKYMAMADSLNHSQSTTSQQTYKAIDYLADKAEAREARKQFRRDLRMQRAMNSYYDPYYNNGWGGYGGFRYGYYNNGPFGGWNSSLHWGVPFRSPYYRYW